nr:TPA_inf: conotoxin precursor M [Conus judaeus]
MGVVLIGFLGLCRVATLQLDGDQPGERYADNNQDLSPDERRGFMLGALLPCCRTEVCYKPCRCC